MADKIHAPSIINVKTNDGGHAGMHHLPAVTGKDNDAVFFDKKNDPKTGSARNLHMFVDHGQLGELDGSQDSHRSNRSNRSASGKNKKVKQQPVPKFEEKNDS